VSEVVLVSLMTVPLVKMQHNTKKNILFSSLRDFVATPKRKAL